MKKFIVGGIITATVMVVAGVIFYACNKEETISNVTSTDVVPSKKNIDEQTVVEAHNIIVDFVIRSKNALDRNPESFEAICADGNMEGLMGLIYNEAEAMQMRTRFTAIIKKISAIEDLPEGSDYCSSCALRDFPETLRKLSYALPPGGGGANLDGEALIACIATCGISCLCCPFVYAECVVICTVICYAGSSASAYMVPYSYENQAYVQGHVTPMFVE